MREGKGHRSLPHSSAVNDIYIVTAMYTINIDLTPVITIVRGWGQAGRVWVYAGVKCRGGKGAEPSHPIVGEKIVLKTGRFRDGNRSLLFREMDLNIKQPVKRGQSGRLWEGGSGKRE